MTARGQRCRRARRPHGARERLDNISSNMRSMDRTVVIEANRRLSNWDRKKRHTSRDQVRDPGSGATSLDLYAFSGYDRARPDGGHRGTDLRGISTIDVSTAPASPDLKAETFSGDITTRVPAASNDALNSRASVVICIATCRAGPSNVAAGCLGRFRQRGSAKLEFKTFSGDSPLVN